MIPVAVWKGGVHQQVLGLGSNMAWEVGKMVKMHENEWDESFQKTGPVE